MIRLCIFCVLSALISATAGAQFYSYPSYQLPSISLRDYNASIADAGSAGTSLVFQWREGLNARMQLQFDAGLADPNGAGADPRVVLGGTAARQLHSGTSELPLDVLGTVGIGGSFGGGSAILRLPIGVSVGHRFVVNGPVAITPYVHPRISIDRCAHCGGGGGSDTNLAIDIDLGMSVAVSKSLDIRAAALFSGSHFAGRDDGFGVSLAWTPRGVGESR